MNYVICCDFRSIQQDRTIVEYQKPCSLTPALLSEVKIVHPLQISQQNHFIMTTNNSGLIRVPVYTAEEILHEDHSCLAAHKTPCRN